MSSACLSGPGVAAAGAGAVQASWRICFLHVARGPYEFAEPMATIREDEGLTVVVMRDIADEEGLGL